MQEYALRDWLSVKELFGKPRSNQLIQSLRMLAPYPETIAIVMLPTLQSLPIVITGKDCQQRLAGIQTPQSLLTSRL